MPYEPIRCPTCSSTKTIVSENGRFFCISCEGWFVWTDPKHAAQDPVAVEAMQRELQHLRGLVKELQQQSNQPKAQTIREHPAKAKPTNPEVKFSDAEIDRQSMLDWFYESPAGIKGPISFRELLRLYRAGTISEETRIRNDRQEWTTFREFVDLIRKDDQIGIITLVIIGLFVLLPLLARLLS